MTRNMEMQVAAMTRNMEMMARSIEKIAQPSQHIPEDNNALLEQFRRLQEEVQRRGLFQ